MLLPSVESRRRFVNLLVSPPLVLISSSTGTRRSPSRYPNASASLQERERRNNRSSTFDPKRHDDYLRPFDLGSARGCVRRSAVGWRLERKGSACRESTLGIGLSDSPCCLFSRSFDVIFMAASLVSFSRRCTREMMNEYATLAPANTMQASE